MDTSCALLPILQQAQAFTECYREHQDADPALRELACLRTQYPALMAPIGDSDQFAGGRAEHRICYVGSMWFTAFADGGGAGKQGGYCFDFAAEQRYDFSPQERACYRELAAFWRNEYTCAKSARRLQADDTCYTHRHGQLLGGSACGFCVALDMDRLLRRGICGLRADIEARRQTAGAAERPFLDGLEGILEVFVVVCRHYQRQISERIGGCADEAQRLRLARIHQSLDAICVRAPQTLHEAMQLLWLYSVLASGLHIEAWRIDVALGDFFAADIDSGRLSEEQATDLIHALWRMWQAHGDPAVCRMTIGGRGRRNPAAADRFCLAAMEATRRHHNRIPQLSLRLYQGQDPRLMEKAFDVIGDGCVFPVLYNDEVILPGVERALHVSSDEAMSYQPLGCGEYMLGGRSPSLLNFSWSVPKTLEAALRGGRDSDGRLIGPPTPIPDSLEGVYDCIRQQGAFVADIAARIHVGNIEVLRQECAFLFASLLSDDCLQRGRSLLDGGARYTGACIMGHGFTNAADGLHALGQVVFSDQRFSLDQTLQALADNFAGHQDIAHALRRVAKFGNDDQGVDLELNRLWLLLSEVIDQAGSAQGLDFLTLSSVNPSGYQLGNACAATPDGRLAGEPFAIGNAPTAGNDRNGLSALLNSLSRIDAANGGAVSNIKLAKNLFATTRPKIEALFNVFWQQGGQQASLSVVNQRELIDAMEHPELYPHLLVRLGGWTARFVQLERKQQEEIVRRSIF